METWSNPRWDSPCVLIDPTFEVTDKWQRIIYTIETPLLSITNPNHRFSTRNTTFLLLLKFIRLAYCSLNLAENRRKASNGWLTSSVYCSVPARLHLHQKIHPFKRGNVPLIISCHLPGLRRFHTLCGLSGRIARYLHRSAINRETVVRRSWRRVGAFREAVSVYVRRIISLANLLRRIGDGDSWQRLNTHWWPVDERVNKIEWNRD